MRFLPIVDRELRVAARRRSTHALRLLAALGAFIILLWLCLFPVSGQPPTELGRSLFAALNTAALTYCMLIGPFITADCVSSEKRDGMLGLLFLTDLNSFDVVLGKWVATSLAGFYGLLAVLPSLAIPLLLGGVTPGEYGRIALAVVNAILFSLTAGMFVSALSRDQTKAILGSLILVLTLSGLLPGLVVLVIDMLLGRSAIGTSSLITLASPVYTAQFAMDAVFRSNSRPFWLSLGIVHGLCWFFMAGTTLIVARVWRQDPVESGRSGLWLLRLGRSKRWQRKLARRLKKNPIFALASRQRWPHWVFWALVGIVAINIYWLTDGVRRNGATLPFFQQFNTAMYFINRVWLAAMACRFFVESRRNGALELILTTPITVRTILRGRRRALLRFFFWPVLAIAMLHCLFLYESWKPIAHQPGGAAAFRIYGFMAGGSLVNFLTDVFALSAVGGWLALSSKKTHFAVLTTFLCVTLMPWLLLHPTGLLQMLQGKFPARYYLVWPAVWVSKNLLFMTWATYKIRTHFRAAAAQTYRLKSTSVVGVFLTGSNKPRSPEEPAGAVLTPPPP
ncbi:MAG TPA: ABC transporter permease subunit [Candidatus Angelobacter sp.]|nr:ABC transporter permease subunit [Candidatus Angelobacter sp.]